MKVKISVVLMLIFISFVQFIIAQNESVFKVGTNVSLFGQNNIISSKDLVGGPSYSGNGFYSFGANFIYAPCKCSDFEAGIEYSHYKITVRPNLPPQMDNTPYNTEISMVSIPANFRINMLKYFFIGGGVSLDFDISKSNPLNSQSGIGISYGLGLKYDFKFGMTIYANPYIKTHSWISFAAGSNNQKLNELGVKLGLTYLLKSYGQH